MWRQDDGRDEDLHLLGRINDVACPLEVDLEEVSRVFGVRANEDLACLKIKRQAKTGLDCGLHSLAPVKTLLGLYLRQDWGQIDLPGLDERALQERQVEFLSLLFDGHGVLLGVICIQCNTKPAPCQGPVWLKNRSPRACSDCAGC